MNHEKFFIDITRPTFLIRIPYREGARPIRREVIVFAKASYSKFFEQKYSPRSKFFEQKYSPRNFSLLNCYFYKYVKLV